MYLATFYNDIHYLSISHRIIDDNRKLVVDDGHCLKL